MLRRMLLAGVVLLCAAIGAGYYVTRQKSHTHSVEQLIWNEKMAMNYGISNPERLRRRLQVDPAQAEPRDAYVFASVWDLPDEAAAWEAIHKRHPQDFESAYRLFEAYAGLGEEERALGPLEAAIALDRPPNGIERYRGDPNLLLVQRCRLLKMLGRHDDAVEACRTAVAKGGNRARIYLGRILLLDDKPEEALQLFDDAVTADRQMADAYYNRGLAHWVLHDLDRANDDWASALRRTPYLTAAERMIEKVDPSLDTAFAFEHKKSRRDLGENLGWCGHYLTELELPQQAERCFEAGERLAPGTTAAQKLWHRAEYDLLGAHAEAEQLLQRNPGWDALAAIGDLRVRTGHQEDAIPIFRRMIEVDLRSSYAHGGVREACQELGDTRCAAHEQSILSGDPGH